ncbi:hypothetical protein N7463_002890 [Penicillium fimorum]|uniref:Asparaginase n=1 Tax=Penicillium fimorum TaxID=1882269 RepID=A0A9W9Y002_9EURO|nr:hypothetical protein N7463_002890 [Penicillium fimorum]
MAEPSSFKPILTLYGGDNLHGSRIPPDLYAACHTSLQSYLRSAHTLLRNGSTALDAAVHAICLLEDDPLFNCGRGSTFTKDGTIEMNASIMVTTMQPAARQAIKRGAGVTGVRNLRHPIRLAHEALIRMAAAGSPVDELGHMHTELVSPEVETLARDCGIEVCSDEWFFTQKRWDEHTAGLEGEKDKKEPVSLQETVGCACLDQWGNLVIATSSGGLTNKLPWKIGDTPTIGGGETVLEDSSAGGLLRDTGNWLGDCVSRSWRNQLTPNYSPLPGNGPSRQQDPKDGSDPRYCRSFTQYAKVDVYDGI